MIEDRQRHNRLILSKLSEVIEEKPYLRFNQILINLNVLEMEEVLLEGQRQIVIKDSFYEESETTWNRIIKTN